MPQPDFQIEVLRNGIVIRHDDGYVLSFYRPEQGSNDLAEHSRYCHAGGEKNFARFVQVGSRAAWVAALQVGWLQPEPAHSKENPSPRQIDASC